MGTLSFSALTLERFGATFLVVLESGIIQHHNCYLSLNLELITIEICHPNSILMRLRLCASGPSEVRLEPLQPLPQRSVHWVCHPRKWEMTLPRQPATGRV